MSVFGLNELSGAPTDEDDIEYLPLISVDEGGNPDEDELQDVIPLLPLRNTVLYPGVVLPITVGRERSLTAVKLAHKRDKVIGVVSQVDTSVEEPKAEDLNKIATAARILKMLKMPDGSSTVIIQGRKRVEIEGIVEEEPCFKAVIKPIKSVGDTDSKEFEALTTSLKELAGKIIKLNPAVPSEAAIVLRNIDRPEFLIHFIASNLELEIAEKQQILEENDIIKRAELVLAFLDKELQVQELKNQIHSKVRTDMDKQQRDYFLSQQLKTIQEELGGDSFDKEIERLKERASAKIWSKPVKETFERELEKLQRMNPASAEHGVVFNYLDTLLDIPWNEYTKDNFNLQRAGKILDKEHYGLDKIKDRIIEYLAVLKLKGDLKSPILCFVGPPGVGKTSLGKSIANALNRQYVRMSLGGLRDEAEIRGHRKTYIGAMPGRIVQNLKKVKSSNPVFILDEIDKVGNDFRGDPSSALLEVLDPEQNTAFYDNYLELDVDLSKIMFIASANSLASIQPALRDRMEIIQLDGYSVEEKVEITKKYLVPKQRTAHGLTAKDIKMNPIAIEKLIHDYTRESGVRDLDRKMAAVMRSVAKKVAMDEPYTKTIGLKEVEDILGRKIYDREMYTEALPCGVAIGMAYTSVGGEILHIESSIHKGKGGFTLTGKLGDVMKESATTTMSYIKSHAEELDIDPNILDKWNVHLHVPEGATPKDGPSAGVTMLTALTSLFSQRKVKPYLAMSGEITLRGRVLPVGGIKEKVLAAKRAGMKEIILPERNQRDIEEINQDYLGDLKFHFVKDMMNVLEIALDKGKSPNAKDLRSVLKEEKREHFVN